MRDFLLFYLNGQCRQIGGETAFLSLADYLRSECRLTGTKVVCAEGDCGACTVLLSRWEGDTLSYEIANACILFLYQLDGRHVITVEGIACGDALHPMQKALIAGHGSQCGYCTPGFVCALAGLLERQARPTTENVRLGLTGNLCRCTGYLPILEAAHAASLATPAPLAERYVSAVMLDDLRRHRAEPVYIEAANSYPAVGPARRTFFAPRRLPDTLDFKARCPEAVIVSGNTELGVVRNKKGYDPATLLSLTHIPGLADITRESTVVTVGANVTWTQMEQFARDTLPEFYQIIIRFGSPQIRHVATLVANVAHGSPIADSLPFLFVTEAEAELTSVRGTRRVRLDRFYKGYKVKDMADDEIITKVHIPLPQPDDLLRLYKVSKRNDLDIATFGAAVRIQCSGDQITRAWVAYSGVAPTVVRLPQTEAFLEGEPFTEETFAAAGRRARAEVRPITDVRGSCDFREQLAENILVKFYWDCASGETNARVNGRLINDQG